MGYKCPPPLEQYPPQLSEFHTELELICLDSYSWLETEGVLYLITSERRNMPETKLLSIPFVEPSLFYVILPALD